MFGFTYYSPTEIVFGPGTEALAGALVQKWGGSRVLVVCGGHSARASGLLDRLLQSLTQAGLAWSVLEGVRPNPLLSAARAGVKQVSDFGADFLLGVGGGSVLDTAKAIANGAANPDTDLWDFWTRKAVLTRALPVGAVLTIPASGSESSDSAVLTQDGTLTKRGLSSPFHRPKFAIMNPELTCTLPREQVACGVVDIMMHTMDRYFSKPTGNELTDEIAQGLLRTVIRNGKRALDHPGDCQAMSELMWAGSLSHNGLTGLGAPNDFAPHQLGHVLSGKYDVAHGASLSAVWGSWARYCYPTNPDRFVQFGREVWGVDGALAAIEVAEEYFRRLEMPTCLSELGIPVQDQAGLEDLARRCTFDRTRTIGTFQVLDYDGILKIYQMANR